MRLGIRTKQVLGVTAVVAIAEAVLVVWYVATLGHFLLDSSRANAQLLADAAYQRVFAVVANGGDLATSLKEDAGLRNILESVAYSDWLEYAIVADPQGHVIVDPLGRTSMEAKPDLDEFVNQQGPWAQLMAINTRGGRTLEVIKPLAIGSSDLGSIRVGVSTLLLGSKLKQALVWPLITAAIVLAAAVLVAVLLSQLVLRPIHVIRGGLARLGRGELDVNVDLPPDAELRELGDSFKQVTARLAADQTELAGQRALESVVDRLEDAVALFAPDGTLLFANAAMAQVIGESGSDHSHADHARRLRDLWPDGHPYRVAVERALAGSPTASPEPTEVPGEGERLVGANLVAGSAGAPLGALLVSRDLAYLTQVETTLDYSRKLAALSRLTSGIAHEIKNPLNATMIHLELLKMQVADRPDAEHSVGVIADQVHRLDKVLQDFMKFSRPEDLHLEAVDLADVFASLRPVIDTEAAKRHIELRLDLPPGLPPVEGDRNLLEQAFLNLALNACQAMPNGGRLRIGAREEPGRIVAIEVEDSGTGIAPQDLSRIFDLYFTTKPDGSGIGLSVVFRTVQLHNGEIEVRSTVGSGTTFRVQLRQAARMFQGIGA